MLFEKKEIDIGITYVPVRNCSVLTKKKALIYKAYGVSQTPNGNTKREEGHKLHQAFVHHYLPAPSFLPNRFPDDQFGTDPYFS